MITGVGAALIHYGVLYFEISPVLDAINQYLADPGPIKFKQFLSSEHFQIVSHEMQFDYNQFVKKYNALLGSDQSEAVRLSVDYITSYRRQFLNAPVIVGASGAVFGILLAFGMLFPDVYLYLYFAFPIKAKYFVIGYGVLELISGIYSSDNVAHFAHLGGMLFGFILIKYWRKKGYF